MISKEMIKFFSGLSGKELETYLQNHGHEISSKAKVTNATVEQLKEVIQSRKFSETGANRTCSYFGDKKVFACLKSKSVCKKPEMLYTRKVEQKVRRLNNKIISKGARVAKIYSIFFADSKYIEIQHRVKGEPLAIANFENFTESIIGRRVDPLIGDYSPEEKSKLSEALFKFNLDKQQKMLNASQDDYDKLFKSIEILANHEIPFYDCHSENVLLGEKGFTIIDINYQTALEEQKSGPVVKSNLDNLFRFLSPFSFATYFQFFLTDEQQKVLNNNNVEILKKLINAVSNNNVVCDFTHPKIQDIVYGMVGFENIAKSADYIFESQTKLRQARGLKPEPLIDKAIKSRKLL